MEVASPIELAAQATSVIDLLGEIAHLAKEVSGSDECDIMLKEKGDGLVLSASTNHPEYVGRFRMGKGKGISGDAVRTQSPILIKKNLANTPSYTTFSPLEESEFEAAFALPLLSKGDAFGVLILQWLTPWRPTKTAETKIERFVTQCSEAIAAYQNAYQSGSRVNRLGALSEVTRTIMASPYLEEILQLLVNLTAQQFNYRVCTVRLLDEDRSELVLRATQATDKAYQRKRAIKLGESIAGRAIEENRPIMVLDVQTEETYIGHDSAKEQGLRSMICVPLTIQDRAVGVMSCYTSEVRAFPPDEISALETLAKQAAISIEHAKLQVRSTLMQEMHHRVKNNLQQVASLLRLQMRHSQYKTLEEALSDSLARILAIAAVHDLLSREDLDHVGVRTIAESLVHHQQQSFVIPSKKIEFVIRGEDVHLNMMQATQVALILNELIQNAVQHGFETANEGGIHITVEEKEGEVAFWVSNDGDKLPPNFDPAIAGHLGLQIVENLTRALGGKFTMRDVLDWAVAEVRFHRSTSE